MRAGGKSLIALFAFLIAANAFDQRARAGFNTSDLEARTGSEKTRGPENPSWRDQALELWTDHPQIRFGLEFLAATAASNAAGRLARSATTWSMMSAT
jgi:hypothetical protein